MNMSRSKLRTVTMLMLAAVMVLAAACGSGSGDNPGGGSGAGSGNGGNDTAATTPGNGGEASATEESGEPFRFSMMIGVGNVLPEGGDNTVQQAIEEHTNTKLDIQWVPNDVLEERINLAIASGEMPHVMRTGFTPSIMSAMAGGMFWELEPYIKDYPNLSSISEMTYSNMKLVDNKLYTLAQEQSLVLEGLVYRQDWLDALGMAPPDTPDELYAFFVAARDRIPELLGVKDVVPFYEYNAMRFFRVMLEAFGAPNRWGVDGDRLTPEFMTPQYMETMNFMKRMYDDNLINRDFAVAQDQQLRVALDESRVGMVARLIDFVSSWTRNHDKNNPDKKINVIGKLRNPADGQYYKHANSGYGSVFVIPKQTVKTEEELRKILNFFDRMGDVEMADLMKWGFEGTQYSMKDGLVDPVPASEIEESFRVARAALRAVSPFHWSSPKASPGIEPEYDVIWQQTLPELVQYAVPNPALTLESPTYIERGTELDAIIADATVQYIMGQFSEDDFRQAVQTWLDRGGQSIIDEYSAAHREKQTMQ